MVNKLIHAKPLTCYFKLGLNIEAEIGEFNFQEFCHVIKVIALRAVAKTGICFMSPLKLSGSG